MKTKSKHSCQIRCQLFSCNPMNACVRLVLSQCDRWEINIQNYSYNLSMDTQVIRTETSFKLSPVDPQIY